MNFYANLRRQRAEKFKIGALVRLSLDGTDLSQFKNWPSKQLNPLSFGPYRVIGRSSPISCELGLQKDSYIHNVFPISKLKLASDEPFSKPKPTPLPPNEIKEGGFELEKILDHGVKRKMYYAKWKGYR